MADIDDLDLDEDFDDLDEDEEESAPKPKRSAKKASGIGASAVAEKLGANAKTFRAWLRRQVANGNFEELADREPRARYTWKNWKDPSLVEVMKAWKEEDHTRGGRKKGTQAKKATTKKAPAKKAPAKKAPTKRRRKTTK